jgi:hypothetical protein
MWDLWCRRWHFGRPVKLISGLSISSGGSTPTAKKKRDIGMKQATSYSFYRHEDV